jgi:chemotaxis protein CheD
MSPHGSAPPLVFLKPGEIVFSDQPMVVTTLLGSCVAVTMFGPRLRFGAICHALLPSCRKEQPCNHGHSEAGKYVECAVRLMLEELRARGIARSEVEAKLFGGSDMFDTADGSRLSVGSQNMEMARRVLEGASLRLVTEDMGGPRGRKIIFHTHTGEVFLKRLRKSETER